jgi:hypothetical protein
MKFIQQSDLDSAISELKAKSYEQIEMETAIKWASRSIIAKLMKRYDEATDWDREAREHASFVGPDFLREIIDEMEFMLKE